MTSETGAEFVERMKREWDGDNVPCVEDFDQLINLARRGAAVEDHGQDARPSEELKQLRAAMMLKIDEKQFLAAVDSEGDYECGAGKLTNDKRAHSAFANSENASDPECTCCGGTGITYQTERSCACQPLPPPPAGETNE